VVRQGGSPLFQLVRSAPRGSLDGMPKPQDRDSEKPTATEKPPRDEEARQAAQE